MKRVLVPVLFLASLVVTFAPLYGALTSSVQVTVGSTHTSAVGLSTAQDSVSYPINKTFPNGSGSTQVADLVYHGSRTLSSAATESLDLYGGLTDAFGATLNFKRVKAIVIENTSASMTITVGTSTASLAVPFFSPVTATLDIPPGGVLSLTAPLAGWTVTDSTGDLVVIANSSGSSTTYKIWILGAAN